MGAKVFLISALCLYFLVVIDCSFIKGKNVPRVGRSNEAEGYYDGEMGYVIKTIPSKNIPRMGRRNYDSENRYDIPKLYGLRLETPGESSEERSPNNYDRFTEHQLDAFYGTQLENLQ